MHENKVSAVIDFNKQTMVGDYRIDVASAVLFSEDYMDKKEKVEIRKYVKEEFSDGIEYYISLYGVYYGLLFSRVEKSDPDVYKWAINYLNSYWKLF